MKYSYAITLLLSVASAHKLVKNDIRGPSTDGPTKGVYQWPTPAPAMAPIPGPFVAAKAAAFAQVKDIRGPTTDGPTKGVYQWPTPPPARAPLPGPHPPAAFAQFSEGTGYGSHEVLNDVLHADRALKIQSVAGPDVTDQIGASVHLSAMEGGDANVSANRHITGYKKPDNFVPNYGVSTTKDAGDLAIAASKEAGAANKAKEDAEEAKKEAEHAKQVIDTKKDIDEKRKKIEDSKPESVKDQDKKEKKLKDLDAKEAKVLGGAKEQAILKDGPPPAPEGAPAPPKGAETPSDGSEAK